jgi:hypothetical protein
MAQSYFTKSHPAVAPIQEPTPEVVADRTKAAVDAQGAYLDHKNRYAFIVGVDSARN